MLAGCRIMSGGDVVGRATRANVVGHLDSVVFPKFGWRAFDVASQTVLNLDVCTSTDVVVVMKGTTKTSLDVRLGLRTWST